MLNGKYNPKMDTGQNVTQLRQNQHNLHIDISYRNYSYCNQTSINPLSWGMKESQNLSVSKKV